MAIDVNIEIESGFLKKWMSVEKMKECLTELEDSDILYPNRAGDLTVFNNKENYLGFIDFNNEKFEDISQLSE